MTMYDLINPRNEDVVIMLDLWMKEAGNICDREMVYDVF